MKLNNNQVSFIYFSLQIIYIQLSQTAHLLYELTVVLFVLFGIACEQAFGPCYFFPRTESLFTGYVWEGWYAKGTALSGVYKKKKRKKIMKRIYCPDVFQTWDN